MSMCAGPWCGAPEPSNRFDKKKSKKLKKKEIMRVIKRLEGRIDELAAAVTTLALRIKKKK